MDRKDPQGRRHCWLRGLTIQSSRRGFATRLISGVSTLCHVYAKQLQFWSQSSQSASRRSVAQAQRVAHPKFRAAVNHQSQISRKPERAPSASSKSSPSFVLAPTATAYKPSMSALHGRFAAFRQTPLATRGLFFCKHPMARLSVSQGCLRVLTIQSSRRAPHAAYFRC